MGWLTPERRKEVLKKYHIVALYDCDYCEKPIRIGELHVIDTRKGFHKWDKNKTPKSCRSFHGREPRVTYHQGRCDRTVYGRKQYKKKKLQKLKEQGELNSMPKTKKKDKKDSKSKKKVKRAKKVEAEPKIVKAVLAAITKKDNHYTKPRLLKKFDGKYEKADVRAAITELWSQGKIRKDTGKLKYYLHEGKKSKKKSKKDASSSDASASDSSSE